MIATGAVDDARRAVEARGRWRPIPSVARRVADLLVTPLGSAFAVGAVAVAALEPRWRAGGLVYLLGYAKNVEITATLAALAAAGIAAAMVRISVLRAPLYAFAACGWFLVARDLVLVAGWPGHVAFLGIAAIALGRLEQDLRRPILGSERADVRSRWDRVPVAAVLVGSTILAFLKTVEPVRQIDVFHHGEVLSTALNLLDGGRPFVDVIWPHGLHDTGLTALWIELTGKAALSSVTLAHATTAALAPITIYWIGRGLLRPSTSAAIAAAVVVAAPTGGGVLTQLGRVIFAALALVLLTSARSPTDWRRLFAAGAAAAVQHLFRIDAGLLTLVAACAAVVHLGLARPGEHRRRSLAAVVSVSTVAGGFAAAMLASWAIVGWPGRAWWRWVLRVLPAYHGDANGLPMPWPVEWSQASATTFERYALPAVTGLTLTALLIAAGTRIVVASGSRAGHQARWLVFVAVFAWLASRTVLGRSDAHVTTWTPVLSIVIVCAAVHGAQRQLGQRAALAVVVVATFAIEPRLLSVAGFGELGDRIGSASWTALVDGVPAVRENVRANPADACGAQLFTRSELERERNRAVAAGTCAVEEILRREFGDRTPNVLYVNSAPWYQARFATPQLSRFYTLLRPYSPDLQAEVVDGLRDAELDAVLFARGYGALSRYNGVHDGIHVPLVAAYLMERLRDVEVIATPIGDLYLLRSTMPRRSVAVAPGPGPFEVDVESIVVDEQSGFLWAHGSVVVPSDVGLERIELRCPEPCGSATLRSRATSGAVAGGGDTAEFELAVFLPVNVEPVVRLIPTVGAARDFPVVLAEARHLPGRSGSEWDDLRDRVQQMLRFGELVTMSRVLGTEQS